MHPPCGGFQPDPAIIQPEHIAAKDQAGAISSPSVGLWRQQAHVPGDAVAKVEAGEFTTMPSICVSHRVYRRISGSQLSQKAGVTSQR
ncbi:hypothetical protein [Hufsiella ginkgonis]|uniref:Uncharacterized protein n=1 Tax=Hufsiella ginkgonis TaxID=2695274 RepID=A0A7K1Y370_9SPHI|nr:hypothetical protein [Hufsiella ginkgonis]MXV17691.1 hypothetical protein [Hufsiella ginkgonis]